MASSRSRICRLVNWLRSVPFGCHLRTSRLQFSTAPFSYEAQARVQYALALKSLSRCFWSRNSQPLSAVTLPAVGRAFLLTH